MQCPDCGYMMTAFEKECAHCANLGKPQKSCLKCGTASGIYAETCPRCFHRFGEPVEPPADPSGPSIDKDALIDRDALQIDRAALKSVVQEVVSEQIKEAGSPRSSRSHPGRIFMMWLLSIIAWIAFGAGGLGFGLFLDIVSVIIAFTLLGSRSSADKGNAWVKIIIETIAFFVGFVNGFNHAAASRQY